jgi:hypothetical protein
MPGRPPKVACAGNEGLSVRHERLVEDWLRTAAVKDQIAGLLRAARPLSVLLDTNVGRQPAGAEPGSRALLP